MLVIWTRANKRARSLLVHHNCWGTKDKRIARSAPSAPTQLTHKMQVIWMSNSEQHLHFSPQLHSWIPPLLPIHRHYWTQTQDLNTTHPQGHQPCLWLNQCEWNPWKWAWFAMAIPCIIMCITVLLDCHQVTRRVAIGVCIRWIFHVRSRSSLVDRLHVRTTYEKSHV